jgi:hypothetical protein
MHLNLNLTLKLAALCAAPLGICSAVNAPYVNTSNPACDKGGTFTGAFFDVTFSQPGYFDLTRSVWFISR